MPANSLAGVVTNIMKILQTPVRFYPFIGGVENYVYYLSGELAKRGHEVSVICANEPKNDEDSIINAIKVKRLFYIGKVANTNITPKLPFALLDDDFDLIQTHLPTPWSADWSAIIAMIKRKPLLLTYYNDIVGDGIFKFAAMLYNRINLKFILNKADRIVIIQPNYLYSSPYLKKYEDKISVIPVGVDVEKFRPINLNQKTNNLFFLSLLDRFHRYKGLDYLLQAFVYVTKEISDVKLIVGGDGDQINRYKREVRLLGIEQYVEFLGHIPDDELVQRYNECDIFILPSISAKQEGFGMVLLEAMACGKPVICTEIVGVAKDIKEKGAGIIVKSKSSIDLAKSISLLLRNKELATKMGAVGRELVAKKYSWSSVADKFEEIMKDITK